MSNEIATTPNQFPVALSAKDRFKMDSGAITWKNYKKARGLTDDMSRELIKQHQAEYMEQKKTDLNNGRILASALTADDRFKRVKVSGWTDKKGFEHATISLSSKPVNDKIVKKVDVEDLTLEELEKLVAERKAIKKN